MKIIATVLTALAYTCAPSVFAQSLVLDDFESGHRIACESQPVPNKYLYNHYDGVVAGYEEITTEEFHGGANSFKETVTGTSGNSNFQFRPTGCSGNSDYMRAWALNPGSWQINTYNRLKFWVKLPVGIVKTGSGNDNFHFGTYTRCTTCTTNSYESGGGHWYHHYNLKTTGEWQQVIVDWHPNSKRQTSGATEHGEQEHPTGETGFNYFDLLTRWYVQVFDDFDASRPVYFDDFEVYTETRPENVDQVYSLSAVYVPSTNEIDVTWQRDKNENDTIHEVRYSFTDIHTQGFANATFAANKTRLGFQGYNGMEWTTTSVDVSGQSSIFVAIKPTDSALFRQIEIPLTTNASSGTKVLYTVPAPTSGWAYVRKGGGAYCWRNSDCELDAGQVYFQRQLTSTGKIESWVSCPTSAGCTVFQTKAAAIANLP